MHKEFMKKFFGVLIVAFIFVIVKTVLIDYDIAAKAYEVDEVIDYIIKNTNSSEGIALKNVYSDRTMNVKHGGTKESTVIDTYPYEIDGTFTERWKILKSDKGYQLRTLVKDSMGLDVSTNGKGIPAAGMYTGLYTPTGDDCSYWKLNVKVYEDKSVALCFENKKTPGLYVGYTQADYDKKGKKRNNFILKTSITEDCWFKVLNPDGSEMKIDFIPDSELKDKTKITPPSFVTQTGGNGVETKIKELQKEWDGKYFTVNGKACTHGRRETCSNCRLSDILKSMGISTSGYSNGYTCCAFQRYIYWKIYGEHDRSFNNKQTSTPVIGDIIECRNSSNKVQHYAIYLGEDDSNYYIFDANYTGGIAQVSAKHGMAKTKYDHYVFYHANNYDEINGVSENNNSAWNDNNTAINKNDDKDKGNQTDNSNQNTDNNKNNDNNPEKIDNPFINNGDLVCKDDRYTNGNSSDVEAYINSLEVKSYTNNSDIDLDRLFVSSYLKTQFKSVFEADPLGTNYEGKRYFPKYNLDGSIKKEKYYSSKECFAWAANICSKIFKMACLGRDKNGDIVLKNKKLDTSVVSKANFDAIGVKPGSAIRTSNHSMIVLGYTSDKIVITDANSKEVGGNSKIRIAVYTWDGFRSFLGKKISKIVTRKDYNSYVGIG